MSDPTPNNSKTLPIHMSIDPDTMEKARRDHLGKEPSVLTAAEADLTKNLKGAFEELGDTFDFSKLTCVNGTVTEKAAQIVTWNSTLSGVKQAMKDRAELLRVKQKITDGLSDEEGELLRAAQLDANNAAHGRPHRSHRIQIAQEIRKALKAAGYDQGLAAAVGRLGSKDHITVELDISPSDFLQATVRTDDGWDPEVIREAGYLSAITRPPRIADTLPQQTTTQHGIKYMILANRWGTLASGAAAAGTGVSITAAGVVTFGANAGVSVADGQIMQGRWLVVGNAVYTITKAVGNVINVSPNPAAAVANAAWILRDDSAALERAEGAEANEATLKWEERSEDIQELAVWIPVTNIQLEDEAQVENAIRGELRNMLRQRVDVQSVFGTGAGNNMFGMIRTRQGVAPTARTWTKAGAARSDQMGDLLKAQDDIAEATKEMYFPNLYYLARPIWTEVALKDTTGSGYYLGSPAGSFRPVLWGLPVIPTGLLQSHNDAGSVGAICLDNSVVTLWNRRGITTEIGLIDRQLIEGKRSIVTTARLALEVRRPQAVNVVKM